MRLSDYKIEPYVLSSAVSVGAGSTKFKILCAGRTVTVKDTYEEAAREVVSLVKDPFFHDRGQTRVERCAGW